MLTGLQSNCRWCRFIALFLIVLGVSLLLIASSVFFAAHNSAPAAMPLEIAIGIWVFYAAAALLCFILALNLFRYAKAMTGVLQCTSTSNVKNMQKCQKTVWKTAGIVTAIAAVLGLTLIFSSSLIPVLLGLRN